MNLPELLATLVAWASTLTGLPVPGEALPQIEFHDRAWFARNVCIWEPCLVVAAYMQDGRIHLDSRWETHIGPSIKANGYLLHELVHWLQDHTGTLNWQSCAALKRAERVAYGAQNQYYTRQGLMYQAQMPNIRCEDD
jgi:hypothetical protein